MSVQFVKDPNTFVVQNLDSSAYEAIVAERRKGKEMNSLRAEMAAFRADLDEVKQLINSQGAALKEALECVRKICVI